FGAMNARSSREVEVKAGQTQQLTLEPQAASVRLRLVAGGVIGVGEVFWEVRDETQRTVWTTAQPEPVATLQAGRYLVRAEAREKSYTRSIELRSGEGRGIGLGEGAHGAGARRARPRTRGGRSIAAGLLLRGGGRCG